MRPLIAACLVALALSCCCSCGTAAPPSEEGTTTTEEASVATTSTTTTTTAGVPADPRHPKTSLDSLTGETIVKGVNEAMAAVGRGTVKNLTVEDVKEFIVKSIPEGRKTIVSLLKGVGSACAMDSGCSPAFSYCVNNVCTCKDGYMNSSDNMTCLSVAKKLGDDCKESGQCRLLEDKVGKTACINFRCSCAPLHALVDGACQGQQSLGTACISDKDCLHAAHSHCAQGVCACPKTHVPAPKDDKCIPLAKAVMDECEEDSQCIHKLENAYCKDSKCVCQPFYHYVANKCQQIKALGDSCSINDECRKQEEEKESVQRGCVDNKCACVKGKQEQDICTSGSSRAIQMLHIVVLLAVALVVPVFIDH